MFKRLLQYFALLAVLCAGSVAVADGSGSANGSASSVFSHPQTGFLGPGPGVGGASTCSHDSTLTGNCTAASPLSVIGSSGGGSGTFTTLHATSTSALDGNVTEGAGEIQTGLINPTGITGTLNDWAPTGFANARYVYTTTSGSTTITGIAGGADGMVVTILSDPANSAGNTITLAHESGSSSAANRFTLTSAGNATLNAVALYSITLRYNGTTSRWQQISDSVATFNRNITNSQLTVTGLLFLSSQSTPAALASGVTNDWGPSSALYLRTTPAAGGSTVTGLSQSQVAGAIRIITNIATAAADTITITSDDGASGTAANRFLLPNGTSIVLAPGASAGFRYDAGSSRWRPLDTGSTKATGPMFETGLINPTGLTGNLNDWTPTGIGTARYVYLSTTGSTGINISGIAAGQDGQMLTLLNDPNNPSGTGISFLNESASSLAANRIASIAGSGFVFTSLNLASVTLRYNATISRWQEINFVSPQVNYPLTYQGALTANSTVLMSASLTESGTVSPSQLTTGNNNDLAITASRFGVRVLPATGGSTLTSLATGAGLDGRIYTLTNIATAAADTLVLLHDDGATGTAANRFLLPGSANRVLSPGESCLLKYDGTSSRWRPMDDCGHGAAVAYNNATITVTDTGTQNDYNPTGLANATIIRINPASTLTINGIAGGTDGRTLYLFNLGNATVSLSNEAAGSTAANRILGVQGSAINILGTASNGNSGMVLVYDGTSSRWRVASDNTNSFNATLNLGGGINVSGGGLVLATPTGHISTVGGTAPGLSGCGTGSPTINGSDIAGRVVTGTTNTGCTLTFASTYTTTPSCICTSENVDATFKCVPTATTLVITYAANSSNVFDYHCIKVQ